MAGDSQRAAAGVNALQKAQQALTACIAHGQQLADAGKCAIVQRGQRRVARRQRRAGLPVLER